MQASLGEAAYVTAAVAEHHAAGAVAVEQCIAQLGACGVLLLRAGLWVAQRGEQRLAVAVVGHRGNALLGR